MVRQLYTYEQIWKQLQIVTNLQICTIYIHYKIFFATLQCGFESLYKSSSKTTMQVLLNYLFNISTSTEWHTWHTCIYKILSEINNQKSVKAKKTFSCSIIQKIRNSNSLKLTFPALLFIYLAEYYFTIFTIAFITYISFKTKKLVSPFTLFMYSFYCIGIGL